MAEWLCSGLQLRVHRFDSVLSLHIMRILITGTAGFIGFHLTKKLLEMGHDVTGLDNINDYYSTSLKLHRLSILQTHRFNFHKTDINNIDSVKPKFDLAINLAAQAGVRVNKDKEPYFQTTNVNGFKKFMKYCSDNSINKIIYASSSSVYDDSSNVEFTENDTDLKPKSIYGKTKLFNETYADKFKMDLDCLGLRFFSVYGPLGRPDMAYYSFTESLKKAEEIKLNNAGSMKRDMTYIDDAVNGIICSINFLMNSKGVKNEIFNIGNGFPIATNELLREIERNLNLKAKIKAVKVNNESKYTHANLKKSRKILGYNPIVSFEVGIKRFLDWHKSFEK